MRNKGFCFGFTKDISKLVVFERDYGKIGSRLYFVHRGCLNTSWIKTDLEVVGAWKFWYTKERQNTSNSDIGLLRYKYRDLRC